MNLFGLNSAAINGNTYGVIAGAAMVTVLGSLDASGTRTQYAQASAVGLTSAQSDGVRNVLAAAPIGVVPIVSAQWALLTAASANVFGGASLTATAPAAYLAGYTSVSASAFVTRPGSGQASFSCSFSASPLVTVGYAAKIFAAIVLSADASVKLNGSSNWQRDGYVGQIACTPGVTADALKTALGASSISVLVNAQSESIKTHGGAAICLAATVISATASTDAAMINCAGQMYANALATRYSDAAISPLVTVSAKHIAIIQGAANQFSPTLNIVAEARLAQLGEAIVGASSSAVSDGLFGLHGEAMIAILSGLQVSSVVYKPANADINVSVQAASSGVIFKMASATTAVSSVVSAVPRTNAQVPAPDIRSMYVPIEVRQMGAPFEDRSMRIAA